MCCIVGGHWFSTLVELANQSTTAECLTSSTSHWSKLYVSFVIFLVAINPWYFNACHSSSLLLVLRVVTASERTHPGGWLTGPFKISHTKVRREIHALLLAHHAVLCRFPLLASKSISCSQMLWPARTTYVGIVACIISSVKQLFTEPNYTWVYANKRSKTGKLTLFLKAWFVWTESRDNRR